MTSHLAILTPGPLKAILAGTKTIESRWRRTRAAPWGRVHAGDAVYLSETGSDVVAAVALVEMAHDVPLCTAWKHAGLRGHGVMPLAEVEHRYREKILGSSAWWDDMKAGCGGKPYKGVTLIWLKDVRVVHGAKRPSPAPRLGWIVGWKPEGCPFGDFEAGHSAVAWSEE